MRIWTMIVAVPVALLASQAPAENWVRLGTDQAGDAISVNKDGIRHGSDGLFYYTEKDASVYSNQLAADCEKRVVYTLKFESKLGNSDFPHWRDHGTAVATGSMEEAELNYVCANAG